MRDVPRMATGWPTIEPQFFTLPQLIREARKWRGKNAPDPGTVAEEEWQKYSGELLRRGFLTKSQLEEYFLPDEIQRREKPRWWDQMEND